MRRFFLLTLALLLLPSVALADTTPGNRLAYLDECDPYYVSRTFPKLVTPQWVGEKGVEAVIILAVDDMRESQRYETFLRPILNRLKKIDGRTPVSIMTNQIKPEDPRLQQWLKEGLSLEVHTFDHPCPFFKSGKFAVAKETYDRCVDLMDSIPNNRAVAFRMPCCDSLNTPSPRFWAEIFNQTTAQGNFLTIDSSVFMMFTPNDPVLPRELVFDEQGRERFRQYMPPDRTFVNTIEDYPYPYVIDRLCWEFPCMTPSDWEAQHRHKPKNPLTVHDWKAAIDCTVIKQGVFTMVFHPHGWIGNEQIVELIDYAQQKYGNRVKFLNFREAEERLNKHLLAGQPLRQPKTGKDNGVRLLDVNDDGYLDVVIANGAEQQTRIWQPEQRAWKTIPLPALGPNAIKNRDGIPHAELLFGFVRSVRYPSLLLYEHFWRFDGQEWVKDAACEKGLRIDNKETWPGHLNPPYGRLLDLDDDGQCELVFMGVVFAWSEKNKSWQRLPFDLPRQISGTPRDYRDDTGVRFLDLNEDGHLDVLFSNEKDYGIYLFTDMKHGWSQKVMAGKQGEPGSLPMISRNGTNNGFWVHSGSLWWSNEDTPLLKDHVDRRAIADLLKDVEPEAKSPQASLRSIQTRPGFTVELMAAEPLVQDPIAYAWGPDGKLWVVEMGDYPLGTDGKGKHGGNVKYLEDTDGDGKYDKATLFLEKLGYPTGVQVWKKGVLVTCAPELFYAEDTNGDGKADVRTPLFVGFSEGNQQHRVNGLVWGLDNWLYCANGDSGGGIKSLKTGKVVNISGRDLRLRPDTGEIEAVTGQSQYGRSRDDWGNWFGNNNSNPMFHFVLADHYLRRNPHFVPPDPRVQVSVTPGAAAIYPISRTLPRFNNPQSVNRFTSANSTIVYRDELFGPHFAGNSFVSEPVHNLIHREIMKPKGVTFTSHRAGDEQQAEFLASSDNWFRPTMLQTGPDGALWVADMYRHVIEHPEWIPKDWQQKLDLRAGHDLGRLYRIYPVDKKPRALPRLDKLDTAGLVAALDSPNGWQRDMAQMMLVWQQDKAAVPLLQKLAQHSQRPQARLHALCTLDGLQALTPELLTKALADAHPGVRKHAIRLSEPFLAKEPALGIALAKLVDDPDAQVRMQLAYSLGEWPDGRSGKALAQLALRDNDDRYLRAAVFSSLNKSNLEGMLLTVLRDARNKAAAAGLLEPLIGMAQRQGNADALASLLGAISQPDRGTYAPWQFSALARLLDTLDERNTTLTKLLAESKTDLQAVRPQVLALFKGARSLAANPSTPREQLTAALRVLGRGLDQQKEDVQLLVRFLSPQTPPEVQKAAVASLGQLRQPQIAELLLEAWKSYGPALRTEVLDALLARPAGAKAVLQAVASKQVLPLEIDVARQQRLLQDKSPQIREQATKLLAGTINKDRQKVIASYRSALTADGHPVQGKAIFARTCAACHQLEGVGQKVGPDLSALSNRSKEILLQAILDPNQAVEAKFISYTAVTKNGQIFSGLLASETGTSITLVATDGKTHELLRADLEELFSSGKSAMPEGLEKDIAPAQMADLLAYLGANIPALQRKTFPGNTPEVVKAATEGALLLRSSNAEIYGPSLILEKQYGNLGWWSNADDQAAWTVEVPRAGKYAVWFDWACQNSNAGNSFVLQAGEQRLTGKVQGTGTWDNYRQAQVGELQLAAGRQRVLLRSAGPIRGAMIDLRSIKLVPMAGK